MMNTIKDYAKGRGSSYEAARQQISRYMNREVDGFRLADHISKIDRTQYLDDEAVAFLDNRRAKNPIIVQQEGRDETIERLRQRVDDLQTRLLAAQDEYRALLQDKHAIELREQTLLADKQKIDEMRAGFEAAERRAQQAETEREQAVEREKTAEEAKKEAEAEKEEAQAEAFEQKKRARDAENAAQEAVERAERAERAAQEAEAKVERMSKAGLLTRIFGTW
jgi:chromosome segregation ATPase